MHDTENAPSWPGDNRYMCCNFWVSGLDNRTTNDLVR